MLFRAQTDRHLTTHLTAYSHENDTLDCAIRTLIASTAHTPYVILHPRSIGNPQFSISGLHMVPEELQIKRFPQFDKSLAVWEPRYGDK